MILILGIAILIPYLFYWGLVLSHLKKEITLKSTEHDTFPEEKISIVCSIRNEESSLPDFLENIKNIESINPNKIHYFFIDDLSTDSTAKLLKTFRENAAFQENISILKTSHDSSGKKQALNLAITKCTTEWVYITDADCIFTWHSINSLFHTAITKNAHAVFGPVIYQFKNQFIQSYQALENSALMILGNFQSARNNKTMGNAANMLVNVRSFNAIKPFQSNIQIAGGDDIFLIESFQQNKLKVETVTFRNAAVITPVLNNWKDLWHQRIRWAKKSRFQLNSNTRNSQILIVLFFIALWSVTGFMVKFVHYEEVAILWGTKILFDLYLLGNINKFYHQKTMLFHKILSSIFQTIFIPIIALAQFTSKVHWKNRSY